MPRLSRLLAPTVIAAASVTGTLAFAPADAAADTAYVVRSGDSLFAIASRFDVSLADLLRANDLTMSTVIHPGERLVVPGQGASSGGSAGTYVVRSGDWLARIASRHGVSLPALLQANDLTMTSLILPGQRLVIPAGGTSTGSGGGASGTSAGTYVVRSGDWLARIASRHGVSLPALLQANDLTMSSVIYPGQRLVIPAGGTSGGPSPQQSGSVARVLAYATAQRGKPWRFAAQGPDAFDCSGLTTAAFAQIGVSLVPQSAYQARQGTAVDFRNQPILAGDLVFQDTNGDGVINHVGIALGNGTWVQARDRRSRVTVGPLPAVSHIVAVRRVVTS